MALALFLSGTVASLSAGQSLLRTAEETNVNQRYVIESVSVAGVQVNGLKDSQFPSTLRERLTKLVGERCDMTMLGDISSEIRREMHLRAVTEHLTKGSAPDRIRVNFDMVRRDLAFDISLPRFVYHSEQGFTGNLEASTRVKQNMFSFGVVSNGDELTERFGGLTGRYDLGIGKVRLGVGFEDFHEQWNGASVDAGAGTGADLYRSRRNISPEMTLAIAGPVTVSVGASFQQMQSSIPAAGSRSANAATVDIHYSDKLEGGAVQQQLEGRYSLRAASHALGSTYAYARHLISLRYEAKAGRHIATSELIAGSLTGGDAPSFERFVLGNSTTLRGWNRYSLDPLGGSRVVHNQLTWGYKTGEGTAEAFYDAGSIWEQPGKPAKSRHSLGFGYKTGSFVLALAFPLQSGHVEPVFMAGMNY